MRAQPSVGDSTPGPLQRLSGVAGAGYERGGWDVVMLAAVESEVGVADAKLPRLASFVPSGLIRSGCVVVSHVAARKLVDVAAAIVAPAS